MKKIFKNIKYEKYYKDVLPYLKKEKNQKYFAVILTLGASIFFALFAISPTLSTIARLQKEVSDTKLVDQALSQKINNLSLLSQAYNEIETDISYVIDAVPKNAEAPTLIAQIQSVAQNSEVIISNLAISPIDLTTEESTMSSFFTFEFGAQGDYENLDKFLSGITNMQRLISIESFSINKDPKTQVLDLTIKGSAFYKK